MGAYLGSSRRLTCSMNRESASNYQRRIDRIFYQDIPNLNLLVHSVDTLDSQERLTLALRLERSRPIIPFSHFVDGGIWANNSRNIEMV